MCMYQSHLLKLPIPTTTAPLLINKLSDRESLMEWTKCSLLATHYTLHAQSSLAPQAWDS